MELGTDFETRPVTVTRSPRLRGTSWFDLTTQDPPPRCSNSALVRDVETDTESGWDPSAEEATLTPMSLPVVSLLSLCSISVVDLPPSPPDGEDGEPKMFHNTIPTTTMPSTATSHVHHGTEETLPETLHGEQSLATISAGWYLAVAGMYVDRVA